MALRLADLSVVGAQITTTDDGETLRRFTWSKGQLVIADRGYANPVGIEHLVSQEADVLVRVNRGALPLYDERGERIDLLAWVQTLPGRRAHARLAVVRAGDDANDDIQGAAHRDAFARGQGGGCTPTRPTGSR